MSTIGNGFLAVCVGVQNLFGKWSSVQNRHPGNTQVLASSTKLAVPKKSSLPRISNINVKNSELRGIKPVVQVLNPGAKNLPKNKHGIFQAKNLMDGRNKVKAPCGPDVNVGFVGLCQNLKGQTLGGYSLGGNHEVFFFHVRIALGVKSGRGQLHGLRHDSKHGESAVEFLRHYHLFTVQEQVWELSQVFDVVLEGAMTPDRHKFTLETCRYDWLILDNLKFLCHVLTLFPALASRVAEPLGKNAPELDRLHAIFLRTGETPGEAKFLN